MDEDLKSLIEQILGKDEKNVSFKLKDFIGVLNNAFKSPHTSSF